MEIYPLDGADPGVLEERMVKMSKSGEGYFWIGGPGEEAFNTVTGPPGQKGCGPDYDYLHLHYRNSATMVAMGMPLIDGIRQMAMRATDPHSRGRNFPGHYSCKAWNVIPVSSVIEIQYAMAPGTALVQKRHGGDGLTLVSGGEAGTAEGDFASCMIWSTRPGNELPVLMVVMNNGWGISTAGGNPAQRTQHHRPRQGVRHTRRSGYDGNDPIASWFAVRRIAMKHCWDKTPALRMLEALVSRLHGHSSSSGAHRVKHEQDCIELFKDRLLEAHVLDLEDVGAHPRRKRPGRGGSGVGESAEGSTTGKG